MAWTNITKPAVGEPTKQQSFASTVVDDLTFLYNSFLSLVGSRETVINGSFESDADGDGFPDGWTLTKYTGGTFSHETSTAAADGKAIHGKRSIKFTSPGGGGNGGGFVTSTDFFEVTEGRNYGVTWQHKSSVAGIHNLAQIQFYDSTQTSISTSTLYDSSANPTGWVLQKAYVAAPVNGRYAKIILTGAKDDNTTAGSAWFDDIRIGVVNFDNRYQADCTRGGGSSTVNNGKWTCPAGVYVVQVEVIGAGGGGGGSNNTGGGGGGGGGYSMAIVPVTPATQYTFAIGVGGTGGTAAPTSGTAGGNSTITIGATVLTANGGGLGVNSGAGGAGGAGGTASGGTVNTTGGAGQNQPGGLIGGNGGKSEPAGVSATGDAAIGEAGSTQGAGGAGGGNVNVGGDGAHGAIIFRW